MEVIDTNYWIVLVITKQWREIEITGEKEEVIYFIDENLKNEEKDKL